MLVTAAAHLSAAASTAFAALVLLALCALIVALNPRRWRRHRYGARPRRRLGPNAHRPDAPEAVSPPNLQSRDARELPDEAAGLPVRATPRPPAHTATSREHQTGVATPAPTASASALPPLPPPALPGARYPKDTFELVAQRLDHSRRLAILEERVARALVTLPRDRWLVERYLLVDGYRIPFVVLGECGVFAIFPLSVRPQWEDTAYASKLAGYLQARLVSYKGPVTPGICGVLRPALEPRYWYRSGQSGGSWVMGLDWLIPWMQHFGHEHGLGIEDVAHLNELAGPNWSRHVKPGPPPVPDVDAEVRGHE